MTAHRYDPYLWVHLAGLATVPFWLILCLLGLAVDYPTWPAFELTFLIGIGSLPVLYMQMVRPFCVFGVLMLALQPGILTIEQRQLLTVFRSWRVRLAAPLVTLALVWCLLRLYQMAPVAYDVTPFDTWGRWGGLIVAVVGFFGANLFLQVPFSVVQVLAFPEKTLKDGSPYPVEAINRDFCHLGLPIERILPPILFPSEGDEKPSLGEDFDGQQRVLTEPANQELADQNAEPLGLQNDQPVTSRAAVDATSRVSSF